MNQQILILQQTLGNCKRASSCTCINKTSYELINLPEFFVFDENGEDPVKIVGNKDDYQLTVRNETDGGICFIKTDKCLFTDEQKKCDCILLNAAKICWTEIKTSASGNWGEKRRKAVEQLGNTIELLIDTNIDLSGFEKKAVICFKNGQTRPTQPSSNSKRAIFFEKYKVSLEEGNEIVF